MAWVPIARRVLFGALVLVVAVIAFASTGARFVGVLHAQAYDGVMKSHARSIFDQVRDLVKKTYYDPTFHGIDFDAHFKKASDKLDQAKTMNQALAVIAQALLDFDDSHLYLDPPGRSTSVDYGFRQQAFGDQCFITAVRPRSDAEAKGVKPGDRLLDIQGFKPYRRDIWKINYFFRMLNRLPALRLTVQSPGGQPRQVDVAAKVIQGIRNIDITDLQTFVDVLIAEDNMPATHRFSRNDQQTIWKMASFDLGPEEVDQVMHEKVRNPAALILDLRGNGGGAVATLKALVGHLFDHDVKLADLKGRKPMEPMVAKKRNGTPYQGKVIVLIDSQSASSSEVFARVMQLEKRGTVIGDKSAGAIRQSRYTQMGSGSQSVIFFGANITDAEVTFTDGQNLEHVGVTPDELLLPTAEDLAAGRDPVLARAIELAGGKIAPEVAGRLFPVEWK